ncbi:MAG TPA: hypothetical protein VGL27_07755 [Negativicutes bacterium]|jgi:hypothetical protein
MMKFRKKTTYENIYKWRRSNNGTCFYCYEDKPVAIPLVGEKGICQECLDQFKVGHVGTDRHVIAHLTRGIRNHQDAVDWLKKHGVKLAPNGHNDNVHFYMAINNPGNFNNYHDIIYGNDDTTAINSDIANKITDSYTDIEIFNDGEIRIIY